MRKITDHKLNGLNNALEITVLDEAGQGGANHAYLIKIADGAPLVAGKANCVLETRINFQNGPIGEFGVNGISGEALLAVLIDRMRCFQGLNPLSEGGQLPVGRAPFACRENAVALTHLEDALMWLQKRTRDRLARGVEGTNAK